MLNYSESHIYQSRRMNRWRIRWPFMDLKLSIVDIYVFYFHTNSHVFSQHGEIWSYFQCLLLHLFKLTLFTWNSLSLPRGVEDVFYGPINVLGSDVRVLEFQSESCYLRLLDVDVLITENWDADKRNTMENSLLGTE